MSINRRDTIEPDVDRTILAELAHFGLIAFTGNDAPAFLHGQLSCDVNAIAPLSARYGSYNTPQGRILATLLLLRTESGFLAQLPRTLIAPIQQRLTKYVLRSKVKLADATREYALLGMAGATAEDAVKATVGAVPGASLQLADAAATLVVRLTGNRFVIVAPIAKSAEVKAALANRTTSGDAAEWDRREIEAGIPWIMPPTQEQFVPQMVNLDLIGGVSFNKGCYPGQEIVARMHFLGRLKQRMFRAGIATEEEPRPGDKLYSPDLGDQACGMIVNAAPGADGGYSVLAVIQLKSAEAGEVHWRTPGGPRLQFLDLPYAGAATGAGPSV